MALAKVRMLLIDLVNRLMEAGFGESMSKRAVFELFKA